jgi:REP element-mobilizing transposase RayT
MHCVSGMMLAMNKYPSHDMQHFIFVTKWRLPFFAHPGVRARAEQLIRHICGLHHIEIMALGFDQTKPDHIHLMCKIPLTYKLSLAKAAQQIKWFSSIHLRKQFGWLREHKYFWGTHYFQKSVGGGEAEQRRYIERQGLH